MAVSWTTLDSGVLSSASPNINWSLQRHEGNIVDKNGKSYIYGWAYRILLTGTGIAEFDYDSNNDPIIPWMDATLCQYPVNWFEVTQTTPCITIDEGITGVNLPYWLYDSSDGVGNFVINQLYDSSTGDDLGTLTLPSTLTKIGEGAFYGLGYRSSSTQFYCTIGYIPLPSVIQYIGNNAFRGSTIIGGYQLPNTLTYIGEYAFAETDVVHFQLPSSGLTYVNNYAFYGNAKLQNVVIPNGYTTIQSGAFAECGSEYYAQGNETSFIIPNSVTTIAADAFTNSYGLIVIDNYEGAIPTFGNNWGFLGRVVYLRQGNIFLKENGSLTRLTPYIKENGSLVPLDWVPGKAISD